MDTSFLSIEAYKGIILTAEEFNHDLTLQFGLLSGDCKDENEYLIEAKVLAKEIQEADTDELDDIFFGNIPKKLDLNKALNKIIMNIQEIQKIPENKKHYEE